MIRLKRYNTWSLVDAQILRNIIIFNETRNIMSNRNNEFLVQNPLSQF